MIKLIDTIYTKQFESTAKLIQIPVEGQTYDYMPQNAINDLYYTLSTRNSANVYSIPTDKADVYINFVPKKTIVTDTELKKYINVSFEYFAEPIIIPEELFTLPEGTIFRCISEESLPKSKDKYQYYLIVDGIAKLIPNYKTLEVLLEERNETLLSVKVINEIECEDIPKSGQIPDKSASWNEGMSDKTTNEILNQLNESVKSGTAIAESATASATQQINAVKAQAAADKAAAEASKAAAEASKAEAEAAKAASEQAIAEANAKIAEIESKKVN